MHRFTVSLFLAFVALLGFVTSGIGTQAQDATPDAMAAMMARATHPVVGGWRFANDAGDGTTFPSVAIFHADGTYTEVMPWGATFMGVWAPTGDRTANVTFLLNDILEGDKLVEGEGRATLEVDETGNTMAVFGNFISLYEDGAVDMAVEGPSTATRLEVLEVVPLGTPVLPPEMAVDATPTP